MQGDSMKKIIPILAIALGVLTIGMILLYFLASHNKIELSKFIIKSAKYRLNRNLFSATGDIYNLISIVAGTLLISAGVFSLKKQEVLQL